MKFDFKLDEKNSIEITRSFWLGKTLVKVNGTEVAKRKDGNYYPIKQGKGKERQMKILGAGFDGVPRVFIDGKGLQIARKLYWYEYLVVCMPLAIIFIGGTMGAVIGAIAAAFNFNIIRREYSYAVRLLLVLAISVAAVLLYLLFRLAV